MKYFLYALLLVSLPAIAEEKASDNRPAYESLQDSVKAISSDLDAANKQHFGQIYGTYALINTVKTVQNDVDTAVSACVDNNPDMKDKMSAQFDDWKAAITPVMDEAQAKVDNMVAVQDYADKAQFDTLFKAIDATRTETDNQIKKIPVTTPESCTYLTNKMDETQKNLSNLLRQTLASYPVKSE